MEWGGQGRERDAVHVNKIEKEAIAATYETPTSEIYIHITTTYIWGIIMDYLKYIH